MNNPSNLTSAIPLSLYIHIPWCVKKCPYCDFNSHQLKNDIPESQYCQQLLQDLNQSLDLINNRTIETIFIGGGTPSLFSGAAIDKLLQGIKKIVKVATNAEVTLEANPGTVDASYFKDYRQAGVNRISLGVQSFNNKMLQVLGRIHDANTANMAIETIINCGFDNFNIDLMYGLPQQDVAAAIADLEQAFSFNPPHLSWYNLTLEPNTAFFNKPPALPDDDTIAAITDNGEEFLQQNGYKRYEVSAFTNSNKPCRHNLNYWRFGDYIGIGAGAHGKITDNNHNIWRLTKHRHPKQYLDATNFISNKNRLTSEQLIAEYMLNNLRIYQPIIIADFEKYTGLKLDCISNILSKATDKKLLTVDETQVNTTDLGKRFLNDLITMFL